MVRGLGCLGVLVLAAVGALVVVWAVWLLFTPDPDGGRHPVGALLLVAGLLLLAPAVFAVRRQSGRDRVLPRRANRP